MRNVVGQAVEGPDLYGRGTEIRALWASVAQGEHIHMLAPRRVGKTSLMRELKRKPRANWHVALVNAEGAEGPGDMVAAIVAELAESPSHQTWLESLELTKSVANVLSRFKGVQLNVASLKVELQSALGNEWPQALDALQERLAGSDAGVRLLVIIDELPVLIARMLRRKGGRDDVELLLAKLRAWRMSSALRGKVQTLVGGSVGLDGVLRRTRLSSLINDLVPFRVESWDRPTATAFLERLGRDRGFPLGDEHIAQMLDLLGDPVPYHVQLFFHELRAQARDASAVTVERVADCFANRLTGPGGTPHLDHYGTRLETALDPESYQVAEAILGQACATQGAATADIRALAKGRLPLFRAVLDELEFDGYLARQEGRLVFRSNLLRTWWRKHRLGAEL